MQRSIRHVTIKTCNLSQGENQAPDLCESEAVKWGPMVELLGKMQYLKTLTFHGPGQIPASILAVLERSNPRARLEIRDWGRVDDGGDDQDEAELALARSVNLRSIQARFWNTNARYDLRMAALKRIIALSPHLEEVNIATGRSGFVVREISIEDFEEEQRRAEKFEIEPSTNSIKSLIIRGGQFVDALEGITDLSRLENLDVDGISPDFFMKDGISNARFKNLKHLAVGLTPNRGINGQGLMENYALESFLACCNSLESLEIRDRGDTIPLSTILSVHGNSLKKLVLHETESANMSDETQVLTLHDAQAIGRNCPLLEDLTIDAINDSSPEAFQQSFALLATFPKLSVLRIYVPLGIAEEAARTPFVFLDDEEVKLETEQHQANPFNPLQDPLFLENSWAFLRSEKEKNGTSPLRELHLKVGEWEREMGSGFPAGWIIWEASHRRYFIARPSERDDRPDEILVQTIESNRIGSRDGPESWQVRKVPCR
jgi:hypothetical protein